MLLNCSNDNNIFFAKVKDFHSLYIYGQEHEFIEIQLSRREVYFVTCEK